MYVGLLLSALNKLPLKLPQNGAGRRHNQKSSTSEPITFDDVAGVDEAKEELAEVVVSIAPKYLHTTCLLLAQKQHHECIQQDHETSVASM